MAVTILSALCQREDSFHALMVRASLDSALGILVAVLLGGCVEPGLPPLSGLDRPDGGESSPDAQPPRERDLGLPDLGEDVDGGPDLGPKPIPMPPPPVRELVIAAGVDTNAERFACFFDFLRPEAGCTSLELGAEGLDVAYIAPSGKFFLYGRNQSGPLRRFELKPEAFGPGAELPVEPFRSAVQWSPTSDAAVLSDSNAAWAYVPDGPDDGHLTKVLSGAYNYGWNQSGTRFVAQSQQGLTQVFDVPSSTMVAEFQADESKSSTTWLGDDLVSWEDGLLTRRAGGNGPPVLVRNEGGETLESTAFWRLDSRNVAPDGSALILHTADEMVHRVPRSGPAQTLFERTGSVFTDRVLWTPAGDRVSLMVGNGGVWRFETWQLRPRLYSA